MKRLIAAALLAAPLAAQADVGGFLDGGITRVSAEEKGPGVKLTLDDGNGIYLAGGVIFDSGLMLKASLSTSEHSGGELFVNNRLALSFSDDVQVTETRFGVYYAPSYDKVGWYIGGGLETTTIDVPDFDESKSSGLYGEVGMLIKAGESATFDLGLAAMKLEDDEDNDTDGAEFHAGFKFRVGPVNLGVAYRSLAFTTEIDGDDYDDEFGEFRLTVGGAWGGPAR